jgi:hypothetical protein
MKVSDLLFGYRYRLKGDGDAILTGKARELFLQRPSCIDTGAVKVTEVIDVVWTIIAITGGNRFTAERFG